MIIESIKNNGKGWRSIAIDNDRKIRVVSIYCRLKADSIIQANIAYQVALKTRFGNDKTVLGKQK